MSTPDSSTPIHYCWNCQHILSALDFARSDHCNKCGKDTRVCKNCKHYEKTAYNECRESQADRVVEKEKANFCDYFSPRVGKSALGGGGLTEAEKAKKAAEDLFKNLK